MDMYIQQLKVNTCRTILLILLVVLLKATTAQVRFFFEKRYFYRGDDLVLEAQYSGSRIVSIINWYFDKQRAGNIEVIASSCTVFGVSDSGYPSKRMSYSCDSLTNSYKATIQNLDGTEVGEWGVSFTFDDFTTTPLKKQAFSFCTQCPVLSVPNGFVNTSRPTIHYGMVVAITCNSGYSIQGSSELTCQADGSWNVPWPLCKQVPYL